MDLNKKMKLFWCLLTIGGFLLTIPVLGECQNTNSLNYSILEKLESIPIDERFILEQYFQILIQSDGLGYVLFGSKPVCLSAYFVSVPVGNMLRGCNSNVLKKGWKLWKKYEKYFPHPHYLIFEENESVEGTEIQTIYFINKEKTLNVIKKYHYLFAHELSCDFDSEHFLKKIEKEKKLLKILNQHEGLLGILLGYGVESSMQYHNRNLVWKLGLPIPVKTDLKAVSVDCRNNSLTQLEIQPIHFVGDPHSLEVRTILEHNAKERKALMDIYSQGKFLEITLKKLMD